MVTVKKQQGSTDEALIKQFTRKVMLEGIVFEAKRRQFHLKPSAARKQRKKDRQLERAMLAKAM